MRLLEIRNLCATCAITELIAKATSVNISTHMMNHFFATIVIFKLMVKLLSKYIFLCMGVLETNHLFATFASIELAVEGILEDTSRYIRISEINLRDY